MQHCKIPNEDLSRSELRLVLLYSDVCIVQAINKKGLNIYLTVKTPGCEKVVQSPL